MIKIKSIEVYKINLPLKEGKYNWSHENSVSVFDSTIVKINTNKNISGFGEVCTLGPAYLPAYPEGVRTGIKKFGKYSVIDCRNCKFIHVTPVPSNKELDLFYNNEYYQNTKPNFISKNENEMDYWNSVFDEKLVSINSLDSGAK